MLMFGRIHSEAFETGHFQHGKVVDVEFADLLPIFQVCAQLT